MEFDNTYGPGSIPAIGKKSVSILEYVFCLKYRHEAYISEVKIPYKLHSHSNATGSRIGILYNKIIIAD